VTASRTPRARPDSLTQAERADLHRAVLDWYAAHARPLPWRDPSCSAWGVLVSEVMAQQTPVARVEEPWRAWMERWPTPAALAAASPGDVVRAWGRLGYPRRALRLREAAIALVDRHGGAVPRTEAELLTLPGVGAYTAAAVAAFAYAERTVVVDTNVRRVLARVVEGRAHASPSLTAAESRLAASLVPSDASTSALWNVAVMELGALVCQARTPRCGECPVSARCAWLGAGRPAYDGPARRGQAYEGTDRKVRGDLLQLLRDARGPLQRRAFDEVDPDPLRIDRLLDALVAEGFVEPLARGRFRLPE
jgi:A/G-specific adenine glycosylase